MPQAEHQHSTSPELSRRSTLRAAVSTLAVASAAIPSVSGAAAPAHPDADLIALGRRRTELQQRQESIKAKIEALREQLRPSERWDLSIAHHALRGRAEEHRAHRRSQGFQEAFAGLPWPALELQALDEAMAMVDRYYAERAARREAAENALGITALEAEGAELSGEIECLDDLIAARPATTPQGALVKLRVALAWNEGGEQDLCDKLTGGAVRALEIWAASNGAP